MAWSIGDYNEFLTVVQGAFGVDRGEAQEVYRELRDVLAIGPLTIADLEEYADVASDLIYYDIEKPMGLEYEEPPWEDVMLDVGDELEITAEVHYE